MCTWQEFIPFNALSAEGGCTRANAGVIMRWVHRDVTWKWSIRYTRWPKQKRNSRFYSQDFALINSYHFPPCWIEHLSLIIITPRSSNFGWELFILWVISYGLSFSGFARFPEFRGTINDKWMANPKKWNSPFFKKLLWWTIKSSQQNCWIEHLGVLIIMRTKMLSPAIWLKTWYCWSEQSPKNRLFRFLGFATRLKNWQYHYVDLRLNLRLLILYTHTRHMYMSRLLVNCINLGGM